MKHKYLLLIIVGATLGLVACKKENKYPIVGKWQEVKLRLYMEDSTGAILYDTTYLHPFTNLDYAQFNNNGTCIIGGDHYYYLNDPDEPKIPQLVAPMTAHWNYTADGSKFVLTPANSLVNPGGFITRDTASASDSHNLLIHVVFYPHFEKYKSISDAYYTK